MMPGLRVYADAGADQYAIAASHYAHGRWDLADRAFAAFIETSPDHSRVPEALYYRGETLLQLQRYQESQEQFRSFNERASKQPEVHPLAADGLFRQGESAYLAGDATSAGDLLTAFLARYPKHALADDAAVTLGHITLAVAEVSQQAEDFQKAKARYAEAIERGPEGTLDAACRFGLARTEDHLGEIDEADRHYSELLTAEPRSIGQQAHYFLGVLRFRQRDYGGASDLFEQLAETASDSPWGIASLGYASVCLARLERIDAAKARFKQWEASTNAKTRDLSLVAELARVAQQHGDTAWSEQLYAQLANVKESPTFIQQGLAGLAQRQFEAGRFEEAVQTFARLATADVAPAVASSALMVRASIFERLGRAKEAHSAYLDLARRFPEAKETAAAWIQAARLAEAAGDKMQAAARYRQVIGHTGAVATEVATARYRLAWVLMDLGDQEGAESQFEILDREHRASRVWADAAFRLARRAFVQKNYKEAGHRLAELVESQPEDRLLSHVYFLQARLAQAVHGWSAMEPPLQKLITETPDSPLCLESRYWLAESAYQRGDVVQATERFDTLQGVVERHDASWVPMVPLRRAQLRAQAKSWSEARSLAEELLVSTPEFTRRDEAYYVIGRSWSAEARFDEARAAFLKAAPRDGSTKSETAAMAQWMIGETYLHQRNYRDALQEYFRTETLYAFPEWQAASLLQAGTCYEQLGSPEKARNLYRQIVQKYPNTSFAKQASRRLEDVRRNASATTRQGHEL